jgi:predicted GNAT superfamily acetyltransferase
MPGPVRIVRLESIRDFRQCELLQVSIWGADPIEVTPADVLITVHRHGGLVLGAYDSAQEMIGFLFGFPGITGADNPSAGSAGRLQHCSHALGVVPEWQGKGVGFRLKLAQREWLVHQGIELVTWTYDPLELGNAVLNIGKLGAVCRCYLRDLYGAMPDALNAGIPSDRFEVAWWINSPRVRARLQTGWVRLSFGELVEKGVPIVNRATARADARPGPGDFVMPDADRALVEFPSGVQAIKSIDGKRAMSWRLSVREAMEALFEREYEVDDVVAENESAVLRSYYLLRRGVAPL